ncbi:MAG: VOC family protein [Tissierellia bacterium]|nr:VOC family protein [Tissierellia bacterium]
MIREIIHVGITVSDIDKSVEFYRDIVGLKYIGEMVMEGPETDALFNKKDCVARVAYLNGSDHVMAPPLEIIQFTSHDASKDSCDLHKTSISEICFRVDDIDKSYKEMLAKGVEFISPPQYFDFTKDGFGKSKALYFKDPDGIILELIEEIE